MLWRWLLDYVAAWWTLIGQRNLGDFKAIYRARRAFLAWRHDFDTDRCFASPEEKAKLPADGRKPYSILGSIMSREESISPTCRSKGHSDLPQ